MLRLLLGVGLVSALALPPAPPAGGGDKPPAPDTSLDDVVKRWVPDLKGAKTAKYGGVIKDADAPFRPRVAAHTFDVTGAAFEDVWNHYADRCGAKERFDARKFRRELWQGADGKPSYAIAERETRPGERVAVFTYRAAGYTASAAIQPKGEGKAVLCVLTVVVDE